MKFVLVGLAIVAAAQASSKKSLDLDSIIDHVNNAKTTWTAGHNFHRDTPREYVKKLMGVKKNANAVPRKKVAYSGVTIPDNFDSRVQWPLCPSIPKVFDQGNCGSCWAVATASAFSDRLCIASNGAFTGQLSAENLGACCEDCGAGCDGGDPDSAWSYLVENGVVTGGDYASYGGCQPYSVPPCEHGIAGSLPQCTDQPSASLVCQTNCTNRVYKTSYTNDFHRAASSYSLSSIQAAQEDIMKYGSIVATFNVYEDFLTYKMGVYQHIIGDYLGGHAVRIIGWGLDMSIEYWLGVNSWNQEWGVNGTFKIMRDYDEGGLEEDFVAGRINTL